VLSCGIILGTRQDGRRHGQSSGVWFPAEARVSRYGNSKVGIAQLLLIRAWSSSESRLMKVLLFGGLNAWAWNVQGTTWLSMYQSLHPSRL
jgi:hypothetical protein